MKGEGRRVRIRAGNEHLLEHGVLWEVECDKVEAGEGSEASIKNFAIKASNVRDGLTRGRREGSRRNSFLGKTL